MFDKVSLILVFWRLSYLGFLLILKSYQGACFFLFFRGFRQIYHLVFLVDQVKKILIAVILKEIFMTVCLQSAKFLISLNVTLFKTNVFLFVISLKNLYKLIYFSIINFNKHLAFLLICQ